MALTKVDTQMVYEKRLGISQRYINRPPSSPTVPAGGVAVGSNIFADEIIEYSEGGQYYRVYVYKTSGLFIAESDITADVLIVAGGGGGGGNYGGGGAGGIFWARTINMSSNTYTVIIGGGGAVEVNGTDSSMNGYIAGGGGFGRGYSDIVASMGDSIYGSSGGGSSRATASSSTVGATGYTITYTNPFIGICFGNNGGAGYHQGGSHIIGGGGGGAGGVGVSATSSASVIPNGGNGINNFIDVVEDSESINNGTNTKTQLFLNTTLLGVDHSGTRYIGGGGGGGCHGAGNGGSGGFGGGGKGCTLLLNDATSGLINTGSGGGGSGGTSSNLGKAGGSGIVVIRVHL